MTSRLTALLHKFISMESAGGIVMIIAALAGIIIANTPLEDSYHMLQALPFTIGIGSHTITLSFNHVVNDLLMVLFFFVIGMELKSELNGGFLAEWNQRLLPLFAALGGMAVPALLYTMLNYHTPATLAGWAIPSATDIAFALSILLIAGRGIPSSVKIFLLAIAIFDDLGAILIIAFFYSQGVEWWMLGYAVLVCAAMLVCNRLKVISIIPYIAGGALLVVLLAKGGIHTTIAGVITGLLVPMQGDEGKESPLETAMSALHPWVSYVILPLFAFISAGISLQGITLPMLLSPITLGIMLGLFAGKQIGVFSVTWLAIKLKWVKMPAGANWWHIYAISVLAGIGFTMSLFIGMLAFTDATMHEEVKLGVIMGSLFSSVLGIIVLRKINSHV
jgi:Na+:H+ antiporter, NhaA family